MESANKLTSDGLPCTLEVNDWSYLSEGNMHLILRYTGTVPNFIGTVLRVRKNPDPLPLQVNKKEHQMENYLQEELLKKLVNEHLFMPDPIVGEMTKTNHLDVLNRAEFIGSIKNKIEPERPEFRRHKSINPETTFELIFDYTFSLQQFDTHEHKYSSVTFEIRPKSAIFDAISLEELKAIFLNGNLKHEEHSVDFAELEKLYKEHFSREKYDELCQMEKKERVKFTRYYKMQIKKQKDHRVETFTHFDPHDFFKNDTSSLKRALKELMETPQNNLKVFLNTKEINAKDQNELLVECLNQFLNKKTANAEQQNNSTEAINESVRELVAKALQESGMIEVIQRYQNLYTGSNLDIATVLENLERLFSQGQSPPTEEDLKQIVESIAKNPAYQENWTENKDNCEALIETIIRFLVSLAFRDCSVLISLHFLPKIENEEMSFLKILEEKGFKTLGENGFSYKVMYTVGLIDFHMKGIRHAYTHPTSTKELFGLSLKKFLANNQTK